MPPSQEPPADLAAALTVTAVRLATPWHCQRTRHQDFGTQRRTAVAVIRPWLIPMGSVMAVGISSVPVLSCDQVPLSPYPGVR
jgi:hypothetical protein